MSAVVWLAFVAVAVVVVAIIAVVVWISGPPFE